MKALIMALIALALAGCDDSGKQITQEQTGYVPTTASAPNPYGLKEADK